MLVAACTTKSSSSTAPTTSSTTATSAVTVGTVAENTDISAPPIAAGATLTPEHLGALPKEGVAIGDDKQGVVLVGLDGRTLGHLLGFTLYDNPDAGGSLIVRPSLGRTIYRLEPGARALAR
ncbi:MAG: hypothetical protein JO087_11255, partial [Actinobacteria bacterium]|nr:hypothetical protein [Actinomycetota bacterium]